MFYWKNQNVVIFQPIATVSTSPESSGSTHFIFLSAQVRSAVEMPQPNFLVTIHEMRDFKNQAGLVVSNLC